MRHSALKKALLALSVIALGAWLASWLIGRVVSSAWAGNAVATAAARPWPAELGAVDAVANRYPPLQSNEAAAKLTSLANALPKGEAVNGFLSREIVRGELSIGKPPPLPDVSALRELLLRETVVWKRPGGVGQIGDEATTASRVAQMTAARSLVASALAKARAHDPAAWEDLHAVWNLAQSVEAQPQMMEQTAAFSMVRMINGVAWKMPLPAPRWFGDLQKRDHVRPLLEAFQYQAASYWKSYARVFPTKWLAGSIEHDRHIAEAVFNATACDVSGRANELGVDLTSVWRRALRYRAEREATANALRLRDGKPIEPKSACSDGTWSFDGTTLRFTHDIPLAKGDKSMPLALRINV